MYSTMKRMIFCFLQERNPEGQPSRIPSMVLSQSDTGSRYMEDNGNRGPACNKSSSWAMGAPPPAGPPLWEELFWMVTCPSKAHIQCYLRSEWIIGKSFFYNFMATPAAHGSSRGRYWTGATAVICAAAVATLEPLTHCTCAGLGLQSSSLQPLELLQLDSEPTMPQGELQENFFLTVLHRLKAWAENRRCSASGGNVQAALCIPAWCPVTLSRHRPPVCAIWALPPSCSHSLCVFKGC